MVDVQLLQTLSVVVASAGVFLAAVYYALQIRHQTRIRKTDLVMRLYQTYNDKEFTDAEYDIIGLQFKDFEDFRKKYGSRGSESMRQIAKSISVVLGFYELVGTLLYRKCIELGLAFDVFGFSNVRDMYEKVKPLILGFRRERNDPTDFAGFEYLYNELLRKGPQLKKTWEKTL